MSLKTLAPASRETSIPEVATNNLPKTVGNNNSSMEVLLSSSVDVVQVAAEEEEVTSGAAAEVFRVAEVGLVAGDPRSPTWERFPTSSTW